jgi:hypothetical protein
MGCERARLCLDLEKKHVKIVHKRRLPVPWVHLLICLHVLVCLHLVCVLIRLHVHACVHCVCVYVWWCVVCDSNGGLSYDGRHFRRGVHRPEAKWP